MKDEIHRASYMIRAVRSSGCMRSESSKEPLRWMKGRPTGSVPPLRGFCLGSSPKHFFQRERSINDKPNPYLCSLLGLGFTYAQHLRTSDQNAPPPGVGSY